jgi:branched-chain amino acid transport system permease protein|tara:strand:- start:1088 stop:1993 length:906 start_codon:yes stop_codon:yes gene_type:complete
MWGLIKKMDYFLQQLINGLSLGGIYALLALGLALVFSIMGLINFAHGDLMTLTGYGSIWGISLGLSFGAAILLGLSTAVVAAILMERIAFRPLRGASAASMLLSSFAISTILHILFQNLISARPQAIPYPSIFVGTFDLGFAIVGVIQGVSILVTFATLVALSGFLRHSTLGIGMRAAAQDFAAARVMGLNANRLIGTAFGISGLLAGIAAVLWIGQRGSVDPAMGLLPVIKAFIAVVLGGLGSLSGAVLGGILLGVIEVMLRAYLPDGLLPYREAISLSIIIGILLLRPKGLLGFGDQVR